MPENTNPIRYCRECKVNPAVRLKSLSNAIQTRRLTVDQFEKNSDKELIDRFARKAGRELTPQQVKKVLRIALPKSCFWGIDPVLTVSFMGGEKIVKDRIKEHAVVWMQQAGITLVFKRTNKTTDIRISFDMTDGSWSYVGTESKSIRSNRPTMNFGWLEADTADLEYRRTVLHEFGHAIGLIHEHQIPTIQIPWNKTKVYAYYAQQGWSKQDVNDQVFERYKGALMNGSAVDISSIMMYPVPKELTINQSFEVGWNNKLSAGDKKLIKIFYPK